jgi:hypothetical protein
MSITTRCSNCVAYGPTVMVYRIHRNLRIRSYMSSFRLCKKCWNNRSPDSYWIPEFTDLDTANEVLVTMILTDGRLPSMEDLIGKISM